MEICGAIYKIENIINGKVYIGQTINYSIRKNHHHNLLIRGSHFNQHLQKSWDKYGETNFKITLLESNVTDHNELNELEIKYIYQFKSHDPKYGYNKTFGGGGVRHTQETKDKVSKALSGKPKSEEHKRRVSETKKKLAINTAERMSEETRQKWIQDKRERMRGEGNPMYGKKTSIKIRKKISDSTSGGKNPMFGKNIKDYMTPEAYEQWKKNVARPGKLNGRARPAIFIYQGNTYEFDYAQEGIDHFKNELNLPVSRNWFYRGVNPKYKDQFSFVGYLDEYRG